MTPIDTMITLHGTLNRVEVRGRENIDMLLGCMRAIEKLLEQIESGEIAISYAKEEGQDGQLQNDKEGV